jgi:hypothetical protein
MKKLLFKFWAPCLLFLLVLVLMSANFSPGTFLSGWDNLHPEFNPLMNLERAWQSAWQEYQGLGLLAGMAHGADLFRQLIFLPLTLLLSAELFRYVWHFLMILTGVLSSFYLFKFLLKKQSSQNLLAFLGASFYLLNFGTVQNFYVSFEPFAAFYAFLPLLLLFLFKILYEKDLKKNLLIFFVLSILSSSMFYVQTIFVVYFAVIGLLFFIYFLQNKHQWKKVLSLFAMILVINAFWLLNVAHFTINNSALLADSKGKAMSNEVLSLKNQAFADFSHLAKLQGFWLGETDFDQFGNAVYLFDAWKTHFSYRLVNVLAFIFFALMILGIWQLFRRKVKHRFFILGGFLLSLWMMALHAFPFSILTRFIERIFPLFDEMFRINFTKWVVPYSLFYSLLLTFGLVFIFTVLKKRLLNVLFGLAFFGSLIFYSWPSFQGHFFYERLRVKIPEAYFELFTYFKNEVPVSSRLANLPQHSFYSWQWNDWGYRGSGFLWYGIKQPILDRAFDVWSENDERYYWQLQTALDKKDVKMLENIFSQYDVDYLLLDTSIVNRNTAKPFDYQALKELLAGSSRLNLVKEFDFLSLYSFIDTENSREKDFISLYQNLPIINNSYKHSWSDQAFIDFHDYLSVNKNPAKNAEIIYPFASLFTNHAQKDLEFKLSEDQQFFYLQSLKSLPAEDSILNFKDWLTSESLLPFKLSWTSDAKQTKLVFTALLPEIYYQKQKVTFPLTKEISLNNLVCRQNDDCLLNINQQFLLDFSEEGEAIILLSTKKRNTIALSNSKKIEYFDYTFFDLAFFDLEAQELTLEEDSDFVVKIPKVLVQADILKTDLNLSEAKNCRPLANGSYFKEKRDDGNYYQATNASVCDHFYLEQLQHYTGYLFKLDAQNQASIPFVFAIQAASLGRSPIETYLSEGVNYQIVPPTENFNQGYTLYLSTDSYGQEINRNLLKSAEVFYWPYQFLMSLNLQQKDQAMPAAELTSCEFVVHKKALWFYQVQLPTDCQAKYLKLSQAYDSGWLALQNGKLLNHQKINNWANAWILDESNKQSIYIFFYPQLLEYLGILALFAGALKLWQKNKK